MNAVLALTPVVVAIAAVLIAALLAALLVGSQDQVRTLRSDRDRAEGSERLLLARNANLERKLAASESRSVIVPLFGADSGPRPGVR